MDARSVLIIAFVCGAVLQAIILIRGNWNWLKIGVSIFVALGVVAVGSGKPGYNQDLQTCLGIVVFAVLLAAFFKQDILPAVSEKLLLSYTLTFWFAFFVYFFKATPIPIAVLCMCLIPTAATIFLAFNRATLNTFWKIAFYTWFLCIIVGLVSLRFSFSQLSMFFDKRNLPWITPVDSFVSGMAFLYLLINAAYLFYLIPIPGKGQSWDGRIKDWHEFTDLMVQRFDDTQLSRLSTAAILGIQGSVLLLVYFFNLPTDFLISVLILLPAVLLSFKSSPDTAEQGADTLPERMPDSRHLKKLLKKGSRSQ